MAKSDQSQFEFVDDLTGFRAPGWTVVRLGGRLRRKQDLLRALADSLHFPNYFGWNWDALEECLRDLSWLEPTSGVVLLHESWPLDEAMQRQTYLKILKDAQADASRPLRVVFPKPE